MKNHLNKILIITLIIFFNLSKSYSIEDVTEFTDAINEAREKFNNASEASTEQSKIIDEAFKEIDKATEYVQDAIDNDNVEDAIKTFTRYAAEEVRNSKICMLTFSPRFAIATETAPEKAKNTMPSPDILGEAFVLAAEAPMALSGQCLAFEDGKLVKEVLVD